MFPLIIILSVVWYLSGVLLLIRFWTKELDLTVGDLIILMLASVLGPTCLILYLIDAISNYDTVIIKRRNSDKK